MKHPTDPPLVSTRRAYDWKKMMQPTRYDDEEFPVVTSKRAIDSGVACAVCFVVVLVVLVASLIGGA